MSTFVWARFLISILVFVSRDFELGRPLLAGGVDRQSHTILILNIIKQSDYVLNNSVKLGW